jgi:hypothetical protein
LKKEKTDLSLKCEERQYLSSLVDKFVLEDDFFTYDKKEMIIRNMSQYILDPKNWN